MISKIFGFGVMFSLFLNVGFAQEALIDDGGGSSAESSGNDLFGGDFFSDLDSFLELEETAEEESAGADDTLLAEDTATSEPPIDPIALEESVDPIADNTLLENASLDLVSAEAGNNTETLQSSAVMGGALPASAQVTLSVTNVSQDNADALQVGARPGDVLQYAISLSSQTDDVVDYVPVVNVSGMMGAVEFTNTGFGVMEGGSIVYPAYSHQAPCDQTFTFFVRVNEDCGQLTSLPVSSVEAGSVNVALNCGLSETGPTQRFYLMLGLIMLVLVLGFGLTRGKTS